MRLQVEFSTCSKEQGCKNRGIADTADQRGKGREGYPGKAFAGFPRALVRSIGWGMIHMGEVQEAAVSGGMRLWRRGLFVCLGLENQGRCEESLEGCSYASSQKPGDQSRFQYPQYHGSHSQWQGKLCEWRQSCAALCSVSGEAKPEMKTSARPKVAAVKTVTRRWDEVVT